MQERHQKAAFVTEKEGGLSNFRLLLSSWRKQGCN